MSELTRVTLTAQGTADVWIGELHIKTFGGKLAHQAACDFAQQIKDAIKLHRDSQTIAVPGTSHVGSFTLDPVNVHWSQQPDGSSIDLDDEGDNDGEDFQSET